MTQRAPFSAVLITLNAASPLKDCLLSLAFADEIIVLDSGSTDGTVELAERLGARVIQHDWLGFGRQKQRAVSLAKHAWVLCLDADERVTEKLQQSIEKTLITPEFGAYKMARCNRFLGRYLRHGEGYPDWNIRLFHKDQARWSDDVVHEHVICNQPPGTLSGDLLHDTAESLATYLNKQNRYTSLAAEAAHAAGKRVSACRTCFSPLFRFLKFYAIRRGFCDGFPGFVHIVIGCFNSFMKYAKMIELQNQAEKDRV